MRTGNGQFTRRYSRCVTLHLRESLASYPCPIFQALLVLWKEYLQSKKKLDPSFVVDADSIPGDLLHSIELVLDKNNHLTEMNRLQGENNIGK